jgi:hypothetical protein
MHSVEGTRPTRAERNTDDSARLTSKSHDPPNGAPCDVQVARNLVGLLAEALHMYDVKLCTYRNMASVGRHDEVRQLEVAMEEGESGVPQILHTDDRDDTEETICIYMLLIHTQ